MIVRTTVATIAGAVVLFVSGYLIWGILLGTYFSSNEITYSGLSREKPSLLLLFFSNLAFASLIAITLSRWPGTKSFLVGLAKGGLIGLLIHLGIELGTLGYMNLYVSVIPVIVDILVEAARTALAGGIIGLVLGSAVFEDKSAT